MANLKVVVYTSDLTMEMSSFFNFMTITLHLTRTEIPRRII